MNKKFHKQVVNYRFLQKIKKQKTKTDQIKAQATHALQSDNQDLKEAQFQHKVEIDRGELEILQKQSTDVRGIASPTG